MLAYKTGIGTLTGEDVLMGALSLGPLAAARLFKYTGLGAKLAEPVKNTLGRLDKALTGGSIGQIIKRFEKRLAERMGKGTGKVSGVTDDISDIWIRKNLPADIIKDIPEGKIKQIAADLKLLTSASGKVLNPEEMRNLAMTLRNIGGANEFKTFSQAVRSVAEDIPIRNPKIQIQGSFATKEFVKGSSDVDIAIPSDINIYTNSA